MSQPMSEREIEEVLASVRRLVAQEERRGRLPPLVLTPEMRIDAGGTDQAEGAAGNEAPPDAAVEGAAAAPSTEAPQSDVPEQTAPSSSPEEEPQARVAGLPEPMSPAQNMPALTDEAAMQALVAQIVRDELSGKLGERITFAVRKLVRNEIARALDEERRK